MAIDSEIGAIHPAQVTAAALFRSDDVRGVVAPGIEGGGERENLGGTELHAEAAGFTALDDDADGSFCQVNPHVR